MSKQALYGYSSPRKREHDKMSQSEPVGCQATEEEPEPVKKLTLEESKDSSVITEVENKQQAGSNEI